MSTQGHPSFSTSSSLPSADVLAQPRKREMLWVSFAQWDRLKGRVTKLGNQRIDYVNYVVGAWGICVPCAISFLVYAFTNNRPSWALPVYGAGALGSGIAAKLLGKFQNEEGDIREEDATDIVAEMQSIEEAFLRTGEGSAGVSACRPDIVCSLEGASRRQLQP